MLEPLQAPKQFGAVVLYVMLWIVLPLLTTWLPFYLMFTRFWWLIAVYWVWYAANFRTPARDPGIS